MTGRYRVAARGLIAAIAIGLVCGAGMLAFRLVGVGLWPASLPWSQMDALVETQSIKRVDLKLDISVARKSFSGEANITVAAPGGGGNALFLLLNPGLQVGRITCSGEELSFDRFRERIRVALPAGKDTYSLTLNYQGWPAHANASTLILEDDAILLDKLQFWYPVDLNSFSAFSATLTVPEHFEVAWSGTLHEDAVEAGRRRVHWEESRPVLATGLAAGAYQRHDRLQGSIRSSVLGAGLQEGEAESYLAGLGDAHNFLEAWLGTSGFDQLNLVVSDHVEAPVHAGGSLLFTPRNPPGFSDGQFVALAERVARLWWGETVTGRWFSTRPEAGEWLVSGLAEYSAWQTLRNVRGRRSYLRFIETRDCPPVVSAPLKTLNLGERLRGETAAADRAVSVRGAYAAMAIANYAGQNAFDAACKNFISVHRHKTVSFGALLHEVTLASEAPLDEIVREWFDRPGVFDYGIGQVAVEPDRVHVTIKNQGDIPAFAAMDLGIFTDTGYHTQEVWPRGPQSTFSVAVSGTPRKVLLDPEFGHGDMRRANNVWPRTEWPSALAVGANGRIALVSQQAWGETDAERIAVFSRTSKAPEYVFDVDHAPRWMDWDPDGRRLLMAGERTRIWSQGQWSHDQTARGIPAGWYGGKFLMAGGEEALDRYQARPEQPYCAAVDQDTGDVAYATPEGNLIVTLQDGARTVLLEESVFPAGALAWRFGRRELLYFERSGDLVAYGFDSRRRRVILHRNYQITRSRISPTGAYAAWIDPAGLLRAVSTDRGEPVYISVPGEIVDFRWEGDGALIALVATIPRRLPMRFHADYSLWRIPVSTWEGIQLPYDPAQFAQTRG